LSLSSHPVSQREAADHPIGLSLGFYRPAPVSVAHPRHRKISGNTSEDRHTGKDRSGSSYASTAANEDILASASAGKALDDRC
jgi:hypothetical protein